MWIELWPTYALNGIVWRLPNGISHYRIGSDLTNQEIEEMIREADKTGDGHVDFEGEMTLTEMIAFE